jgi:hypothetical protein
VEVGLREGEAEHHGAVTLARARRPARRYSSKIRRASSSLSRPDSAGAEDSRRQRIAIAWRDLSRLTICDFSPRDAADWFRWKSSTGDTVFHHPAAERSWTSWRSEVATYERSTIPQALHSNAQWLLPFVLTRIGRTAKYAVSSTHLWEKSRLSGECTLALRCGSRLLGTQSRVDGFGSPAAIAPRICPRFLPGEGPKGAVPLSC